jgi:hypothetical protein
MNMKRLLFPLAALLLTSCAAMQPATTEAISKLPIVRVGDTPPKGGEYIVHYPAGYEIPVTLTTRGSLFGDEQQIHAHTTLAKDLYLFKYWASHDGKHWMSSHTLLDVKFSGGFDVHGLQSNIELDTK